MIKIYDKRKCSGCKACLNSCPAGAVKFFMDNEGFFYPSADENICIQCGKCDSVCPYNNVSHGTPDENISASPEFFAARLKDKSELQNVSSGGAFWAFSETVIKLNGIVYGAVQDKVDNIYHIRASSLDEIQALRRSKYLQSDINTSYIKAENDLLSGKIVLFSGTGCQIAGLNCFLGKRYENLFTCEVVCHGVPSFKIWQSYRTETERKKHKRITGLIFRDKSKGWSCNQYRITYDDGSTEYESSSANLFHSGYLRGFFYRPSCGTCPFAKLPRTADISLADFWKYSGTFTAGNLGVSLIAVNNSQGRKLLDMSSGILDIESASREHALTSCRHMNNSPVESPLREEFIHEALTKGYYRTAGKFFASKKKPGILKRIKRKLKSILTLKISRQEIQYITDYYRIMGKRALFSPVSLIFSGKNSIFISDVIFFRRLAGLKGIKIKGTETAAEEAIIFYALKDALILFARKNIPVYFYNRVNYLSEGKYSDSEKRRMHDGLTFPVMYENISAHEEDLREIFGGLYSQEYIEALGKIPQVILTSSTYRHEDISGKYINILSGKRITFYQPDNFSRTIHIYGRCGVFGYAVEDKDTLPSQIQKELIERGFSQFRVINHGLWGGSDAYIDQNFLQDSLGMKEGDLVIFYRKSFHEALLDELARCGMRYNDITEQWHNNRTSNVTFFNQPGHMNSEGYKLAAKIICDDLIASGFECGKITESTDSFTAGSLNFFLKSRIKNNLQDEIQNYISSIKNRTQEGNNGAIVMNCNPFTLGHRGLIETASRQADYLYVFVVQEDKSFFSFADRFEMICRGTQDLNNVIVLPGGNFIISAYTFPEYFMKDYVKEKSFNVSGDIEIFCRYIAPALNIKIRFAGEEPFDPVTEKYNKSMSEILPDYGMKFVEIPRIANENSEIITATKVRSLLAEGNLKELKKFVPDTTYEILLKKYIKI